MRDSAHIWAPGFTSFGGGIGAFSRELAVALASEGTVRLIGKTDRSGSWNGLHLNGSGHVATRLQTGHFVGLLVASGALRRPRLIISTHVHFGPVARGVGLALGVPFVLVAHGVEIGPELSASRQRAIRAAKVIWAVSRWTRDRLAAIGVNEARIHLLPNTVSGERFATGVPDKALMSRHGIAPSERVILTVARLASSERYKGCDRVLMALPAVIGAVGSARYLICGAGDDMARLQALAVSLGVDRHVTFCGFVADAELPAYYRLAHVFAMPSTGEGFGIAFLEAMASGVPVIGGNRDGTVDALASGELGCLVDPNSSDAIADAIIRMLTRQGPSLWFDPARLRARCLDLFGREAFARRVRELVLGARGPSGGGVSRSS